MSRPTFDLERSLGVRPVAGVDEVGRGPWAGPVVACAVVLDQERLSPVLREGIKDSKALRPAVRSALAATIRTEALAWALGSCDVAEIDRLNILQATMTAMQRAVAALPVKPAAVLVDGNRVPALPCPAHAAVKGDRTSLSIAAAAIVAKVHRDSLMADLETLYPGYGWARHAGYGTPQHRAALETLGVTPVHRRSFAPIRELVQRSKNVC